MSHHLRTSPRRATAARPARIVVAGALLLASSAGAATTVWKGPSTGGSFNDADNWTNGIPGTDPDDLAIFNASTNVNGTITFSESVLLRDTHFRNTSGTIELDVGAGHTYAITRNTIIGAAAGELNDVIVSSGEVESRVVFIGNAAGADGNRLTVTGAGTMWTGLGPTAAIRVGSNGGSDASLTISGGAHMDSGTQVIVGLQGASNNTLTVTGAGSQLSVTHSFSLGDNIADGLPAQTNNQFKVLDGGFATVRELIIGTTRMSPGNTVTVSGPGSHLNVRGGFQVAPEVEMGQRNDVGRASPDNSLIVENGGVVDGGAIFLLGRESTSTNNLLSITDGSLTGTGIEIRRGKLLVENSTVEINQWRDPLVNALRGSPLLAQLPTADIEFRSGVIITPNATISNGAALVVGDGGVTPATYRMKLDIDGVNGTHSFANGLSLAANGVLEGPGNIAGNVGGASGATARVGGSSSFGIINVTGDWNNTGLEVLLDIGDLTGAVEAGVSHDLLDISGTFTHGGSVQVDLSNLQASSAMELQLIGWGASAGDAGDTAVSFLGGSATFDIRPDGLYVDVVPAMPLLPGDANRDGRVDGEDFLIWQAAFGTQEGATWDDGDFNGDGRVDGEDFLIWQAHFGSVAESSAVTPEPASVLPLAPGALALMRRVRSRRPALRSVTGPAEA